MIYRYLCMHNVGRTLVGTLIFLYCLIEIFDYLYLEVNINLVLRYTLCITV